MATSGSFTITTNVYAKWTFSWERTSYVNGASPSSTISWTLSLGAANPPVTLNIPFEITVDGTTSSGTAGVKGSGGVLKSGTKVITHASNGSGSFVVTLKAGTTTETKTYILDTLIVPATLLTATNFTDEENPAITYSNPSGNSLSSLQLKFYSFDGNLLFTRDVTKSASSYQPTLTAAERKSLRQSIKTGYSATIHYYLVSTIGGTSYTSKLARTLTLVDYEPTLDPSIPIDTNSATVALTGDDSILVRSYSNVYVETGAEAQKEATIASQYIINGSTTVNEGSATFNGIESNTFYYSVTDSRGFTTKDALVVDLVPYFKPTISLSVLPFSLAGDLTFALKGKYFNGSFGARSNSFAVSYVIVESGQSISSATYQNVPRSASTISGNDYTTNYTISGLDPNKSYQLMVRIQDSLDASYASRQSIAASPIFDWSRTDFNFNVPIYLKDTEIPLENLKDYITLQGESGDWFYRLWYSGKVELFGTQDISYEPCNVTLGGWYRTNVLSSPTYPFTVNNPIVTANYESDGYGAVIWPTTKTTTSKPFDYYLIRPTSSASITGKMTFHVVGELGGVIA